MSSQPDRTSGECGCPGVRCIIAFVAVGNPWQIGIDNEWHDAEQYCPYCGYYLADDGYAYRMVRAARVAELERELAIYKQVFEDTGSGVQRLWLEKELARAEQEGENDETQ